MTSPAPFSRPWKAGTLSLGAFSLPLLGAFALIGWYWNFGRALAAGGGQLGDALASAVLYAVNIGVAYWLLVNLAPMATAAYQTFLQWGLAAGGSQTSGLLLTPSAVVDMGFQIAEPLQAAATRMTGWSGLFNMPQIMLLDIAAAAIVVAFPLVAVALMVTQIEYQPECHGGGRAHSVWHFWADRLSDGILYRLDHGQSPARAGHGRHGRGGVSPVLHGHGGHDGGGRSDPL